MNIKSEVIQLAMDPKTAAVVATTTTGTGISTIFDLIPGDIGKLATLIGMILSIILIYSHILSVKKTKLEITILKEKEKLYTKDNEEKE